MYKVDLDLFKPFLISLYDKMLKIGFFIKNRFLRQIKDVENDVVAIANRLQVFLLSSCYFNPELRALVIV